VVDGQIRLPLQGLRSSSAYQLIFTPAVGQPAVADGQHYPAAYAGLSGGAVLRYAPEAVFVTGSRGNNAAGLDFVVSVEDNAFYTLSLRYACIASESGPASLRLVLNGAPLTRLSLPPMGGCEGLAQAEISVFLTAGINRVALAALPGADLSTVRIASLDVTPGSGWQASYEAEAEANTLSGTAAIALDPAASGGKFVKDVGGGPANALQFNQINVPHSGPYRMVVTYANAEFRGGHTYNSQVVDRFTEIRVNGASPQGGYFRNTFTWDNYQTRVVDVDLQAGANTLHFSNPAPDRFAPHIDKLTIAACIGSV
jgi:hypothetical protein